MPNAFYPVRPSLPAPIPPSSVFPEPIPSTPPIQATDPEIRGALQVLENTWNLPEDEAYLQSLGVNIIFRSGREALDLIRRLNAKVEFGDLGDLTSHAAWIKEENRMVINQKYRGNTSLPVLYAIAAAIYHEAGHAARLSDNQSSIQEEIDCLALNTMAYRSHVASDPQYEAAATQGPLKQLFDNGVTLYPKLFFDPDPCKHGLVNRVIEKYGTLQPETPDHPIPHLPAGKTIAERVLYKIQRRSALKAASQG